MSTLLTSQSPASTDDRLHDETPGLAIRCLGAALALAIAYIHITDQGGIPGDKGPHYVAVGYWVLEVAGVALAAALLSSSGRRAAWAWTLSIGLALGPLLGYVLSRGPGLPGYTDDKGVWTEPLGLVSLLVEGSLLILALSVWTRTRVRRQQPAPDRG